MKKFLIVFIMLAIVVSLVLGLSSSFAGPNCPKPHGNPNHGVCAKLAPPPCTLGVILNNMTICVIPG